MTAEKTLDDLFAEFVSGDPIRGPLCQMHRDGDFVYVTNGHIGFEIPADLLEKEYPPVEECPNLKKFIHRSNEGRAVSVKSIERALAKGFELVPVYRKKSCGECGGGGIVECFECGHETDCDTCAGRGEWNTNEQIGTRLESDIALCVRFCGAYFNPNYVRDICTVARALGESEILITDPADERHRMAFNVGRVRGVIMSLAYGSVSPDFIEIPS